MRHKILLQTNPPWMKTGLGENGRALMKYFLKRKDKYELVYYCTQGTSVADPMTKVMPVKAYGCIPNNPQIVAELQSDPAKAHSASYGNFLIDEIVEKEKPTIWLGSDDIWSFAGIRDKPWFKKINSIYHVTVDSRPVLEEAFNQARSTKHFYTWAKFASKEMKRVDPLSQHAGTIYGAFDTHMYYPITPVQKAELRKRFGISDQETIFFYLSRNQLRKGFPQLIQAFAEFKKDFPFAKARLHFHTSFSEKGNGWDIPKLMSYYGLKKEDILCTYVCRSCGQWHVKPYDGEDIDCPYCGAKKSMITCNVVNGVPDEEMPLLYGMADASPNVFTSGGLERGVASAMLCGLPVAVTNYSCGEDYCEQPFVHSLKFNPTSEANTNFIKAATDISSIKSYFAKIHKATTKEKKEWSERGRDWAVKTFSTDVIGEQWEKVFDSMPHPDWSSISVAPESKNPDYPMPDIKDNSEFVLDLYKNVLKMDETKEGDGYKNWMAQLNAGITREAIYKFFIDTARTENQKNVKIEFGQLIDKARPKKRGLILIKESIGDCYLTTGLFKSFHKQYPDHDLYVMTDPKYFEVFEGNPHVYKLVPYIQAAEQEMLMMGVGGKDPLFHVCYHPAIATQRVLNYLSHTNTLQVKS